MLSMIDSSVVNIAVPDIVTDLLAASTAGLVLLTAQTPAWLTALMLRGRPRLEPTPGSGPAA